MPRAIPDSHGKTKSNPRSTTHSNTHPNTHPNTHARHWKLQLAEGVVLVALGLVAAFLPFRVGMALFVWLFLIGGFTGLVTTLLMWRATGFWWSLLSAILAIGAGIVVLALPMLAVVGFSLLLMIFLVLEGIVTVMFALEHWRDLSGRWGWMLASGIVDLSLAAFILIGLPGTADWTFGLILGANMIFGGGALIGMALSAQPIPKTDSPLIARARE